MAEIDISDALKRVRTNCSGTSMAATEGRAVLAHIERQAAEIERLRGALADSNIAAHSLASRLTGLGVRIVKDRDLIDREEVMALVVRWRSMWDDALKESK